MKFYVYEHWRLDRDECFYVGKGTGRRAYEMSRRNIHHKAIQAKVAREGFAIEVRIVACGLTEEAAFSLECERIRFWRAAGVDLANMTDGGEGMSGHRHSPEIIERVRQKNIGKKRPLGRKLTEEHKAKISVANTGKPSAIKGKKRSEKTRAKMKASAQGRIPVFVGKEISEETRDKIRKSRTGKKMSEESKAKLSAALTGKTSWNKGRKLSDEHRAKLAVAQQNRHASKKELI